MLSDTKSVYTGKLKYIYLFVLTSVIGLFFIAAFTEGADANDEVKQNDTIIKFSHSFHADLAGCADCHSKAAESVSLVDRLMPDHESCGTCHDVEDSDQCQTCHYEDVYEPLVQSKNELLFNHKFHVADQAIQCESCHKGINAVDYAFQSANAKPSMEDCFSCHNDMTVASNACESCHISTVNLVPQSHKDVAFIKTHKFEARDVAANCVMCHDNNNNSCVDCHAASGIDAGDVANNYYQPYAPNSFSDGAKKQKLNKVHELNYRFVHGIDAKLKSMDCQSCHEVETFCATCHQAEGSNSAMGIVPASHLKPGFFTIGVGTGGGDHATLAKRDIESCASCHDTQGADPTCITCHHDSDGIPGTNSKTHPRNFMKGIKGDWHDSMGSICFNCHISTSTAGVGFCGYCHSSKVN